MNAAENETHMNKAVPLGGTRRARLQQMQARRGTGQAGLRRVGQHEG